FAGALCVAALVAPAAAQATDYPSDWVAPAISIEGAPADYRVPASSCLAEPARAGCPAIDRAIYVDTAASPTAELEDLLGPLPLTSPEAARAASAPVKQIFTCVAGVHPPTIIHNGKNLQIQGIAAVPCGANVARIDITEDLTRSPSITGGAGAPLAESSI